MQPTVAVVRRIRRLERAVWALIKGDPEKAGQIMRRSLSSNDDEGQE